MINKFLLERKDFTDIPDEDIELIKQRDARRLRIMEEYCRTTDCLRNYILDYFGEKTAEPCDNCGNCHRKYRKVDMTAEAKWVINCVAETKGRYGQSVVLGTLLGADRARLKELGTVNYKSYGRLKEHTEAELRLLVSQMISDGYIYQTEDQYSILKMEDITSLRDENTHVIIRIYEEKEPSERQRASRRKSTDSLTSAGYELFEKLRSLRLEIAREEGMPPYIIFNDRSLIDMCVKVPKDRNEMLNVSGVGEAKFDKYGHRFLDAIRDYRTKNPDSVLSICEEEALDFAVGKFRKETRGQQEFYLNEDDADKFQYNDLYYISNIKDELNRITTADHVKKVTIIKIWEYMEKQGLVEVQNVDGKSVKVQTKEGLNKGIVTVEKVNQSGDPYTLLMYPPEVQKEIVSYFIRSRDCEKSDEDLTEYSDGASFDRSEYNRRMNRPEGAGAPWSDDEDKKLNSEFESGMEILEIAAAHRRTAGAICARLRKHGLIE